MKKLIVVALVVTSIPAFAAAAPEQGSSAGERRHCTQVTVRAGSRMSGRRVCRTPSEWREALGPDWRQHLAGNRGVQEDYEAMQARMSPNDGSGGQEGVPFSSSRARPGGPN